MLLGDVLEGIIHYSRCLNVFIQLSQLLGCIFSHQHHNEVTLSLEMLLEGLLCILDGAKECQLT